MEQQRRFMFFMLISLAIMIGWQSFVLPILFPLPPKPPAEEIDVGPVSALYPENMFAIDDGPSVAGGPVVQHPLKSVMLGSKDPRSPFFMAVFLTSRGAAVNSIQLNDPRYPEFGNRQQQLTLLGHDPTTDERTFATAFPGLQDQFGKESLETIHWEVVQQAADKATFRLETPDGSLRLLKDYWLEPVQQKPGDHDETVRDTTTSGYELHLRVTLENLKGQHRDLQYALRGPVGLPLEDPQNSHKFLDVRMGFLRENGQVDNSQMTAATVADKERDGQVEVWKRPVQYLGIDTQYFAALVQPVGDQLKSPTLESSQAVLISERKEDKFADISVLLTSMPRTLSGTESHSDEYRLYAGPKREALLAPLKASSIVDYGWFAPVVRVMLAIVHTLHAIGLSYGLAIIGLTCLVRAAMIPLTLHQARSMDKMKELQPKIKSLHEKYKKDPSSLSPDEMRQMQEVNLKMFAGCLPLLAQMPIFISLYRALQVSVDLRMAPFHLFGNWIDNLASPDALFAFGFAFPFFGWTEFNLLPLLSIVLMQINQKLTMPPPADEEQAMQYRMMNIMMLVMVVFFYRVPAGLCLYFIMSSVWGTSERLIMKRFAKAPKTGPTVEVIPAPAQATATRTEPAAPKSDKPGFFSEMQRQFRELQEMADKQQIARRENGETPADASQNGRKGGKNKKRR